MLLLNQMLTSNEKQTASQATETYVDELYVVQGPSKSIETRGGQRKREKGQKK